MNPPLIPGISFNHFGLTPGGQFRSVVIYPPGSWQAQGGAGGIAGPGHLPMMEQPQVYAATSTAEAIMRIPR